MTWNTESCPLFVLTNIRIKRDILAERICELSIEADETVRYLRVSVKWGFHSTAKDLELFPLSTTRPFMNKKCS